MIIRADDCTVITIKSRSICNRQRSIMQASCAIFMSFPNSSNSLIARSITKHLNDVLGHNRTTSEVISQWLNTPGIPDDARDGLLEILSNVKKEMGNLPDSLRQTDSKS